MNAQTEILQILDQVAPEVEYVAIPRHLLVDVCAITTSTTAHQQLAMLGAVRDHLTKKEYMVFDHLLKQNGATVRSQGLMNVADIDNAETLWVHVRRLRRKLEDLLPHVCIQTWRGMGYALVVEGEG